MKVSEKYSKSLENKWVTRFKTIHPDGDNCDGVVLAVKRSFLVIKEATDFEFDGTIILPKRVVRGYRDSEFEQCYNDVIRSNGQIKNIAIPDWLHKCSSVPEVLDQLKSHDMWPGVETLFDEGKGSAFYLGPILETREHSFSINCYDAAGRWEKVYDLKYDEIFRIEFDSKYCNHFNNYMKAHNNAMQPIAKRSG